MQPSAWDIIQFRARLRPHAVAVITRNGAVSFATLVRQVGGLATELVAQKLVDGRLIGVAMDNSHFHLLTNLALLALGVPSMAMPSGAGPAYLAAAAAQWGIAGFLADHDRPEGVAAPWTRMDHTTHPTLRQPDAAVLAGWRQPDGDQPLRLLLTSGTTGDGKLVALSRRQLAMRLTIAQSMRAYDATTRHFMAMPPGTVYGYNVPLAVLAAGGALVFGDWSADWVTTTGITSTGVTPQMLERILAGLDSDGPPLLPGLRYLDVMGSHLPPALAARARAALTPNVWNFYGSTECGYVAATEASTTDPTRMGCVLPWVEVQVVDPANGAPLPAGQEGLLRIRGDHVTTGYHLSKADAASPFRDGWFYPGDVGVVTAGGVLHVTGRTDEILNIGGRKISPVTLEAALCDLPQTADAAVFPVTGADGLSQAWAAVVLKPDARLEELQARAGQLGLTRLLAVNHLPRNANGKLMRKVLGEEAKKHLTATPAQA